jgi:predicted phage-related endonuclease
VAALFGCSPYSTLFEVWHRKAAGAGGFFSPNSRVLWGQRLEAAIARGIAEDQGWTAEPFKDYMRMDDLRLGASFDYLVRELDKAEPYILEIKNVDGLVFKQTWVEDGDSFEAPPHIEIQVQHQLLVAGLKVAYIGALIGGNRVVLIRREAQPDIQAAIMREAAKFWASVAAGEAPTPDFEKDAAFIASLYQHAEPGKIFDAQGNGEIDTLVREYQRLGQESAALDKQREGVKAQLLTKIGDAEKVLGEGWSITAGVQGPTWVEAYERKGFRTFRVNLKKAKATPAEA